MLLCRMRAAIPATCGVAIEVPLIVFVAVSLVRHADRIDEPGAKISTPLPKLENDERASVLVDAPTVIASATRAGEKLAALVFELPAAIAYVTPAASNCARRFERGRRAAAQAHVGDRRADTVVVTQSTPAITPALEPDPLQESTRTAKRVTLLATP